MSNNLITVGNLPQIVNTNLPVIPNWADSLVKSLNRDSTYYRDEAEEIPVEWDGTAQLKKLAEWKKSCFVIGEPGSGRRTAAVVVELDNPEVKVISLRSTADFYREIWELSGCPLPPLNDLLSSKKPDLISDAEKIIRKQNSAKGLTAWPCQWCPMNHVVIETFTGPPSIKEYPGELSDVDIIRGKISAVEGDCKLRREMVQKYPTAVQGKTFIVSIPEMDEIFLNTIEILLASNNLIILATPTQITSLDKRPVFQSLPHYQFPKPEFPDFQQVANLLDLKTFIDPKAIAFAAALSNQNFGEFIGILHQAALTAATKGQRRITPDIAIEVAKTWGINAQGMVAVTLIENPQFNAAEVKQSIFCEFNTDVQLNHVKAYMHKMGKPVSLAKPLNNTDQRIVKAVADLSGVGQMPVSQIELVKKTGLSKASVSPSVSRLLKSGYLKRINAGSGKPDQLLPSDSMSKI